MVSCNPTAHDQNHPARFGGGRPEAVDGSKCPKSSSYFCGYIRGQQRKTLSVVDGTNAASAVGACAGGAAAARRGRTLHSDEEVVVETG
jgi:hypothetical protein